MALDSYTNLKQSIIDHLDRDDLSGFVDDFIDLAEARHKREIRIMDMIERDPITFVTRYADLPSRYLEALSIRLLTGEDPPTILRNLNLHEMMRKRIEETTGIPQFFTVHNQIELDRVPDQAYSGEIIYYKELNALSDNVSSNAILSRAPDCYLYAALAASAPFLMNDERVLLWEGLYTNARDALNQLDIDAAHIGPLVARVDGITP